MILLALLQFVLGLRVAGRLWTTAQGDRIVCSKDPRPDRVSIVIPVLNEGTRIEQCLETCIRQTEEACEILVVDGGSTDETHAVVEYISGRDPRVRWVDASPVPGDWTGKAWGLQTGLSQAGAESQWILCLDADVTTAPELTRSLLYHAARTGVVVFSVATLQRLKSLADALLHPSLLTTLVYRFGMPGRAVSRPGLVQANGQCFFAKRSVLEETHAIRDAKLSICEDITLARCLAAKGYAVGFYEGAELVAAAMYESWKEIWQNWPRSLPMRDQYFGWREALGLAEVLWVQALSLPLLILALWLDASPILVATSGSLFFLRLGVLVGTSRAYPMKFWTYWLSPLVDLPVAAKLITSALQREHHWRGRRYTRRPGGRFLPG